MMVYRCSWLVAILVTFTCASASSVCAQDPPYVSIHLDRDDWGYTGKGGVIVTSASSPDDKAGLQLYNPVTQDNEFVATTLSFYQSGEIKADGWLNSYKGWIYRTSLPQGNANPRYVFVSNELSKGSASDYPIAFFFDSVGHWRHAFGAERGKPGQSTQSVPLPTSAY